MDRYQVQALLETLAPYVYFQPPPNVKLQYPCIIYKRNYLQTEFADDLPYRRTKRYQVTVVDRNPDSTIPDAISALKTSTFDRHYTADNLNHDVYNVFF